MSLAAHAVILRAVHCVVSCVAGGTLCVAIDAGEDVWSSTEPTGGAGARSSVNITEGAGFGGQASVSCASVSLCALAPDVERFVGFEPTPEVFVSTNPTGGASAWPDTVGVDTTGHALDGIDCVSPTLCVGAGAGGNVVTSESPSGGTGGSGGGGSGNGGAGGAGGGGGTGGAGGGAPVVHLTTSQAAGGAPLVFDGAGTQAGGAAITGYELKLSGAAGAIDCGPGSPIVSVNFAGPAAGTATLTALTAGGAAGSASVGYSTGGPHLVKRARRAASPALPQQQAVVSAQCKPAAGAQPSSLSVGGHSVNAACEVHAGLVDAVGCGLHQVQLCSAVPAAERRLLEGHQDRLSSCGRFESMYAYIARAGRHGRGARSAHAASGTRVSPAAGLGAPLVDTYYVSSEPIRVNGLDIVPKPGAAVVLAIGGLYSTKFTARHAAYLVSSAAARAPPRPGRPGHLRVRQVRSTLLIGFAPAPLAVKHFVTVHLSDGRRLLFVLKGRHHSVVVHGVGRKVKVLSVRVRGEGFGVLGPAARR